MSFPRVAVLAWALVAAACTTTGAARPPEVGVGAATPQPQVVVGTPVAPALPVTVRSADGREVTITDTTRIVSLWGNVTEIVFGLGLGDRVVGRDITATFPEAEAIPLVTRAHDVSAESVLSLHPTLVLASVDTGPASAIDHIRNVGVPVVRFAEPQSVDDVVPRIRTIAAALGVPAAGEDLAARTEAAMAAARDEVQAPAVAPRVAFLYMRGHAGVYLIGGPRSGADSMIVAAGATDAGTAMGLDRPFTPISSEALVRAAPEVILMTTTGLESVGGIEGLVQIPGIAQTPAGRDRRIVTLEDSLLFAFGPRTPVALRALIEGLHAPRTAAPSAGARP
ncbi:MAG: ABC transporter substrate-binding protein [Dehalococcoidia bacterium]|nr:ABC transporter substrate-binding protein [Dehalococcoidia bacterium]